MEDQISNLPIPLRFNSVKNTKTSAFVLIIHVAVQSLYSRSGVIEWDMTLSQALALAIKKAQRIFFVN